MRIFLTGASGLIGGTIAAKLLAAGHGVRGLVRDEVRGRLVAARGIAPVVGTLDRRMVLLFPWLFGLVGYVILASLRGPGDLCARILLN